MCSMCFVRHHTRHANATSATTIRTIVRVCNMRIDHILTTPALSKASTASYIDKAPRKLERPSDHTPVVLEFNI